MKEDEKNPKKPLKFICDDCQFITSNKKDFNRHNLTLKHQRRVNGLLSPTDFSPQLSKPFQCDCGKVYKYNQGLWKHQQKCTYLRTPKMEGPKSANENDSDIKVLTDLVLNVVKQNKELTDKIVDICKHSNTTNFQTNNIMNSNINSNNKTFNLHFFLNETCKNAMNITDFVDSLQLQLTDLENVGNLGYIEGISNIIVKNLNALDETTRPIHCTDKKRETFYVKDENKWEKEDQEKNKIKKMIKTVANKNQRLLVKFKECHPDCNYSNSTYADKYSKLVIEAMGGCIENHTDKEEKIIKKIAKEVTIGNKCLQLQQL